jgi:FkbM family methyltransferase
LLITHSNRSDSNLRLYVVKVIDFVRTFNIHIAALGLSKGIRIWTQTVLFSQKFEHQFAVPGLPNPIILRAGTSDLEVYKKIFIDEEYALPFDSSILSILDLGANTGMAALYFHRAFPNAQIVTVEPDPANFEILTRNLNGIPNVKPIRAAVWTHDGEIQLFDPGIGAWGLQVRENATSSTPSVSVPAISLPSLLREFPSGHLDLLKIDIEGAEKEILENADSWMPSVTAVVIELHDRYKAGCSRAFYRATNHLQNETHVGENIWVWRKD